MFERVGTRIASFFDWVAAFLFDPYPGKRPRWLTWAWLAALFLAGLVMWGIFFNWGGVRLEWQDWAEVSAPRLAFLQNAVKRGLLPLHMSDPSALRGLTDRYMAIPDVILAPQAVLLGFLRIGRFILADAWIMYTLGFAGLLWFWRKYHLSPINFGLLFLLFNFNGYVTGHFSVGHINFVGYFLFPWLLAMVIHLLESTPDRRPGWAWVAGFSFLMFLMLMNGSFHQFIWWLIFLGLFGLFSWKHFPLVLKTLVFTCLLSLFRLLPPALYFGKFPNEYLGGYPSLYDLWQGLISLKDPYAAFSTRSLFTQLSWWEFDLYVGLIGAALLLFFGVYRWLKRLDEPESYPALLLPSLVLAVISIAEIFKYVRMIPLPLIEGERVSSRMIIIPFLVVLLMACLKMREWLVSLRLKPLILQWGFIISLLVLFSDIWEHLKVWKTNSAAYAFPEVAINLPGKVVANHPDPAYTNLLLVGGAVTILTAIFLLVMVWVEKRKQKLSSRW